MKKVIVLALAMALIIGFSMALAEEKGPLALFIGLDLN